MKIAKKKINIGIGFVTGRKNFKDVVKTYVYNLYQSENIDHKKIALHIFVAYDLKYSGTKASDYRILDEEILDLVDSVHYIGESSIVNEAQYLVEKKVVKIKEAKLIFGDGFAKKRNVVLYFAIKNRMDYLIFLDDDEYPIAAVKTNNHIQWEGQEVLATHIRNMDQADITHGYHCGYISPIPTIKFDDQFSEDDFRLFIEAISNDIINWDSIKEKMEAGGVTYADVHIANSKITEYVKKIHGMKFISGANLGVNLKNIDKIFPFYNPPGARGEDTFLSTSIGECEVLKVPTYTFHDGFGTCNHLLQGVLPKTLKPIKEDSGKNTKRFLKASIGWIRYKPLLLYITHEDDYEIKIREMKENLTKVIPKISAYFGNDGFKNILKELDYYDTHVIEHYESFKATGEVWVKILKFLKNN